MREIAAVLIATAMMTVFFTLALYYLVPMPIEYCAVAGFVVTVVCVMGHELIHKLYAVEFCNRRAVFDLAKFSVILTIVSIFILAVLIYIKDVFGWQPWIVPIIASPGGVYVAMRKADRCYDNIAVAAPLYNYIVGILLTCYLFSVTSPPFVLNDTDNFATSLVAITAFFSFALAFFNTIPIKIGDVATDGYWAFTVDKRDMLTKITAAIVLSGSFCILFLTDWWVIKVVS